LGAAAPVRSVPARRKADFRATIAGIGYMLAATVANAAMAAGIHHVSHEIHPFEIAFFRSLVGVVMLAPLFLRHGSELMSTAHFPLHMLRAAVNVIAMLTYYLSLSLIALAEVTAINFSAPLFCSLLAVIILGERLRLARLAGLVLGFAGTLIVLQPSGQTFDPNSLVALFSAMMWGASMIIIKVLSARGTSASNTLWFSVLVLPVTLIAASFVWVTPSWTEMAWLVGIGVAGTLSTFFLTEAFRHAEATVVLPFDFTKLVWASLIGAFIFAEPLRITTWLGAAIIIAAATYVTWVETRDRGRVQDSRE